MRTNVHQILSFEPNQSFYLPLFLQPVKAGFPSPAEEFMDTALDLNQYLVQHPAATFFVRVSGDSMINAGIYSGDLLVVDRSLNAIDNSIIIAVVNGEITVKRIKKMNNKIFLVPENKEFSPLEITAEMNFEVWGVVTFVIHKPV